MGTTTKPHLLADCVCEGQLHGSVTVWGGGGGGVGVAGIRERDGEGWRVGGGGGVGLEGLQ